MDDSITRDNRAGVSSTQLPHSQWLHADLTGYIIAAAIEVHRHLGPGLLESIYESALARELALRQIPFSRQHDIPVVYKDELIMADFRIDLLVADEVIVELKAVETLMPVHESQLLTYLKLAKKRVGLLINFNVPFLRDGIVRRIL